MTGVIAKSRDRGEILSQGVARSNTTIFYGELAMMEIDLKSENIDTLIQEVSKGVSALTEGPLRRWNEKRDLIHAMNMGKIVEKARAKMGQERSTQENSAPLGVESGWLLNFLDKSKTVSDDEMQDLWASILAGEANCAGSYSPKTLTIVTDVDQKVATLFNTFCSLCIVNLENPNLFLKSPANFFKIRDARVPIITGSNTFSGNFQQGVGKFAQKSEAIYQRYCFGTDQFQLLLEHGLIQDVNTHTDYSHFWYNDEIWGILKPDTLGMEYQEIKISGYSLSSVGKELFHITKRSNPPGHFELLIDFLQECYTVEIDRILF